MKVRILNTEYNLQGNSPEDVEKIANYVDNLMQRIKFDSPNQSVETIAVVSCLNAVETYFKERELRENSLREYCSFISDCNKEIDDLCRLIDNHILK